MCSSSCLPPGRRHVGIKRRLVDPGGAGEDTLPSLAATGLTEEQEAFLCGLGGARLEDLEHGDADLTWERRSQAHRLRETVGRARPMAGPVRVERPGAPGPRTSFDGSAGPKMVLTSRLDPLSADIDITARGGTDVAASQRPAQHRPTTSWLPAFSSKPVLQLDPVTLRVLVTHVIALLAVIVVLLADSVNEGSPHTSALELAVFIGFASLRIATARRTLATSTLVLDATGTVIFLAGTDAPASPYFFLALAGAWWAAHVRRSHSGIVWGVAFAAAYGVLVVPEALRDHVFVLALEDMTMVAILGVLSDWFVRVDRRAIELSEALAQAPVGAEKLAIREGLSRALGPMEIPLDILLTAAREGFTVIQAELLAYLAMGLTNQEIADATTVSEATVRLRLTGLYRALGVRGRKAAVARAHEIGLVPTEMAIRRRDRT